MSNKKILKRTIFVTEFTARETSKLNILVRKSGSTKAVILRALVREALKSRPTLPSDSELLAIARAGKL